MAMRGYGVLLTGESGTGKSELALQLVRRGHSLVSDDAPELVVEAGRLVGRSSYALAGKLQLRGLGVIDLKKLMPREALQASTGVDLVVSLSRSADTDARPLEGSPPQYCELLGIRLPCWILPVDQAPASPELVELAVQLFAHSQDKSVTWN